MDYLTENDNVLLEQNKLKDLSIFSKLGEYKQIDKYNYFETNNDEYVYYSRSMNTFFDHNKKILLFSKYIYNHININNIKDLYAIILFINNINLDLAIDIGNNIIAIEHWFLTYGHFKDSVFNQANFYELIQNNECKFLVDIPEQNISHMNYSFINYHKIVNYLFAEEKIVNSYKIGDILKMKKLFLIENGYRHNCEMFHSFPQNIVNKILYKLPNSDISCENIFITRGVALHLPRNLANEKEVEDFIKNKNFKLINPEELSYEEFINNIKNSKNIVITWGSALVNLIYLNDNTNIYILKNINSYKNERLDLFRFIKNRNFNIKIIESDENGIIDLKNLEII